MKTLPCVPLRNNNWINWFIDQTQLIGFFQKIKIDQKFLSIDFDSWSELSGLLMANRKLVKESKSRRQLQRGSGTYIGVRLVN